MLLKNDKGIICEQCGTTSGIHGGIKETMKYSVLELGWNYVTLHLDGGPPIEGEPFEAHFYCKRCKAEFDCDCNRK